MEGGAFSPTTDSKASMLWALYVSERDFIKHHEVQRINASNILAAIAAGLIVAIGSGEMSIRVQWVIAILLMAIGLFGYLFCGKLYALIQLHAERSYEYLDALEAEMPDLRISEHKSAVRKKHAKRFPIFGKLPLHTVWGLFHVLIFLAGLLFLLETLGLISDLNPEEWRNLFQRTPMIP